MTVFFKNIFELIIHPNLHILDNYNEALEDLLETKKKEFEDFAEEELEGLTDEQINEYNDFLSDEYWLLSKAFPNILRSYLFVACYSLLEYGLVSLCKHLQKKNNYKIELEDIIGKGINRVKTYLKKVAEINFPDQTKSWNDIINYSNLRNFIVHNQGRLDNSNKAKKVGRFIKKKNWVELDKLSRIQFKKGFFREVKKTIEDFSTELSRALK